MRINYCDEEDYPGQFELWRANVRRSLRGVKGQAALRDLEAALLALPDKRLIYGHLAKDGDVCAVGAIVAHRRALTLGQARESVLRELEAERTEWEEDEDDEGETEAAGEAVGVPRLVAWRLVELNDMDFDHLSPEARYERVLAWTRKHLAQPGASR